MTIVTMPHGDPSFSERESALILQRAAELQAQQGRGLSLPELESAAAEAGIDVALVRQAAAEVTTLSTTAPAPVPVPAPASGGLLGAPLRLMHERVVDGELDPSRESDVMAEITWQLDPHSRKHRPGATRWERTGASATTEPSAPLSGGPAGGSSGGRLTWANPDGRKIKVALVPRGGRTVIRVEEQISDLAGGLFLGMGLPLTFVALGFILPICLAVIDMPVLIPVAFIAWAAMVLGMTRLLFTTLARQRDASLRALADGLAEVCQNAPPHLNDPAHDP